ncbi:receptor kinase-like protein Xa21 [Lathyrus oleraceus]|uniref:non-specific serine/threonine protein kinase n=1 Tax=Pisum sativum TaxID=3888 RepID=A0A9D4XGW1_PEA|nr:receptor kinase-like protein Xa21 [Pisum sativum]KAI5419869.1 hypothetical protein KIW84_043864 [Pisum sativum]
MVNLLTSVFLFCLSLQCFVASFAANTKNITTDESALLAFKSLITSDPSNKLSNNWSTSSSICNWVGVTCHEKHNRVHSLRLENMGLRGTLSPNLGNLSFLVILDLSDNSLSGPFPKEICRLRRLKYLDFSYNEFVGEIPAAVGDLSQLQYLYIGSNNFSGSIPNGIGNLSQLKNWSASHNRLSGVIPETISNLSSLEYISLAFNYFSGKMPNFWHQCEELKILYLQYNSFNKGPIPGGIRNITKLRDLCLSGNNLEGQIPSLNMTFLKKVRMDQNNLNGSLPDNFFNQLPQLETFTVYFNSLEGNIPRSIGNCTSLKFLAFAMNFFTGPIPEEIGHLDQFEFLELANNSLSGTIPPKLFNMSSLTHLHLELNHFSGLIPSNKGYSLPSLQELHLNINNFVGNIPASIFNASNLVQFQLSYNKFSGSFPDIAFGNLRSLQAFLIHNNGLTIGDPSQFFNSLKSCRNLLYLDLSGNHIQSNLPRSIGNISSQYFQADSCGIYGNIPLEVGNMSNLLYFSVEKNNISGPIPGTFKGLLKLQVLNLGNNGIQGSFNEELCEMKSLSELYLDINSLSGSLPTCLGNMTFLKKLDIGFNNLNSKIPSSLWSLTDILEINLTSNAFIGNLPPEIGNLRAILLLDLSRNQISSNIPSTISVIKTLQSLSLAHNKLYGSIPTSLGDMLSLISLDLSQNLLTGAIPNSLTSLLYLQNINFSYNGLQGEIPDGGPFKNFTAQSFMHNEALCGNPRLQVPPCRRQVKKRSLAKKLLLKCMVPIVVSITLIVACIILLKVNKRKKVENTLEKGLSTLGAQRRISYYELVQATNGFNEGNLLGRGGFGSVYQGKLPDGEMIAVKVIDLQSEEKSRTFDAECNSMRNLRHRNLVKIISSCSNLDFKSLVMEFMSNGSVDKWLYSDNYYLTFLQRLNIMIDVASALEYLHHGSPIPVVHCDLKPTNVLLDEDMVAHVSDFGIAKLMDEGQSKTHTQTLATIGYLAPEYGSKGIISVKGDVYSYGIMLMEVFTRRKPTDDMFVGDLSLKTWISGSLPNSIMEVLDSNLIQHNREQIDKNLTHISSIFRLSLNCCEYSPEERINMVDVKASLIRIKTLIFGRKTV